MSEVVPTQLARWAERSRRDPRVIDAAIALALVVLMQVQLAQQHVGVAPRLPMLAVLLAAFRRTHPVPVTLCIAAAVALQGLSTTPPSNFGEYLAVMLASYTAASECRLWPALTCGLALAAGIVAHDIRSPEYGSPSGMASDLMIPVIIWGVGRAVRFQRGATQRSQRRVNELEQQRLELARTAVAAERAYLARELHDVVSHSVSVVVIQAQGAKVALGSRAPDVQLALDRIEDAGRTALTEMRHLLGLMRDENEALARVPQPGLAELPALVARVRQAGLPTEFTEIGQRPAANPGVELSAYRIVQEALTNALKHAGAASAVATLRYEPGWIDIAVTDNGRGGADRRDSDGGRGLIGLHERVTVYGGTLDAGPLPGHGFGVRARLPIEPGEAGDVNREKT